MSLEGFGTGSRATNSRFAVVGVFPSVKRDVEAAAKWHYAELIKDFFKSIRYSKFLISLLFIGSLILQFFVDSSSYINLIQLGTVFLMFLVDKFLQFLAGYNFDFLANVGQYQPNNLDIVLDNINVYEAENFTTPLRIFYPIGLIVLFILLGSEPDQSFISTLTWLIESRGNAFPLDTNYLNNYNFWIHTFIIFGSLTLLFRLVYDGNVFLIKLTDNKDTKGDDGIESRDGGEKNKIRDDYKQISQNITTIYILMIILGVSSLASLIIEDDTNFEARWTFPFVSSKLGLHGALFWLTLTYCLQIFKEYNIKKYITKSAFTRHSYVYMLSLMFMISKGRKFNIGNGLMIFNLLVSFATTMIIKYG